MNVPALVATYQLRQREYLLRITRAMTSRLDLPSLLELILASAADMISGRAGLIVLESDGQEFEPPNTGNKSFQIRAFHGIPVELLSAFEPLLDVNALLENPHQGSVMEGDLTAENPDEQLNLYFQRLQQRVELVEEQLGLTLGKVIGLPLLFEEEFLGIIYLFRGDYAFTQLDWQFLQGFAYQAAIAVRNAKLYHQLETERSRLVTIVENSADGILILDASLHVLVINQALSAMIGLSPENAIGHHCRDVLLLDNVQGDNLCREDGTTSPLTEDGLRCEGDLINDGDNQRTVAVTYTPIYEEKIKKEQPYYLKEIGDQSQSQTQEQAKQKSHRRLVNIIVNVLDITRFREEDEVKSTFTSIISHELKTPVALIKGYAQTLARPDASWDAETARQSLQIIEEEADRLEGLINNLLDVSRIQASGLRLDYADVDIQNLIKKVVLVYQSQTEHHRITLDFPHKLPSIWGDAERLRQILTNLLNNAIKYSPDGGLIRIGGWFEMTPYGTKSHNTNQHSPNQYNSNQPKTNQPRVVLYVSDQGIGIPPQELPHIFVRFYRIDTSLRRRTAGAGLGLFLSKVIVDAHNGQIWARSEVGKGTTFFIALPVDDEQREGPEIKVLKGTYEVSQNSRVEPVVLK